MFVQIFANFSCWRVIPVNFWGEKLGTFPQLIIPIQHGLPTTFMCFKFEIGEEWKIQNGGDWRFTRSPTVFFSGVSPGKTVCPNLFKLRFSPTVNLPHLYPDTNYSNSSPAKTNNWITGKWWPPAIHVFTSPELHINKKVTLSTCTKNSKYVECFSERALPLAKVLQIRLFLLLVFRILVFTLICLWPVVIFYGWTTNAQTCHY